MRCLICVLLWLVRLKLRCYALFGHISVSVIFYLLYLSKIHNIFKYINFNSIFTYQRIISHSKFDTRQKVKWWSKSSTFSILFTMWAHCFCYDRIHIIVYKNMYFNYIKRYENQNKGRFVLYWGKTKDFPMEVDKIISRLFELKHLKNIDPTLKKL